MVTDSVLDRGSARVRLLDSAVALIRRNGYGGTSVDALCAAAGVTKGAFFHHFPSKEALGVAAASHWSDNADVLFGGGAWHADPDPVARVLGYVDFRLALIDGEAAEYTCLAGTMVQELHDSSPAVRDACRLSIFGHAATLEADLAAAIAVTGAAARFPGLSAASLAAHTQAVLQGGFVLSKAAHDPAPVRDAISHLRRYLQLLFNHDRKDR